MFTLPQTICLVVICLLILKKVGDVYVHTDLPRAKKSKMINAILQLGIFSFFFGVFGQALGILQALRAIEQAGDVSPAMIFGGIKVSMYAPVYGLGIFLVSLVAWSILKNRVDFPTSASE